MYIRVLCFGRHVQIVKNYMITSSPPSRAYTVNYITEIVD